MQTGGGEEVGSWPTKPPLLLRPRDGPRPVVPAHSAERGLGARACSMEKRLAEFRAARQASAAPPAPPPPPPPAKTPRAEATAGKEQASPPPEVTRFWSRIGRLSHWDPSGEDPMLCSCLPPLQ
ncbi:SAYSvFN domain-containing protein 1 isoform X2 [Anolis carolinensis]|uniref:SAYSvFN domain-containing protein 1 isoform X2 n=1 Tax=Anolis carolinensis TaxID=28377 RepID=UPI002F2B5D00